MMNQKEETTIYTALGQYLIDSLEHSSIKNWDAAFLKVGLLDGVSEYVIEYRYDGKIKNIGGAPASVQKRHISYIFKDLKQYTDANNYTPWNRFVFEITPKHQFNIKFEWDQKLNDTRGFY